MLETVVWALLTGGITGGAWVAIVLLRKQHRLEERQRQLADREPAMGEDVERRLDALESVEARLADVEERLDFTERLLARQRDAERLPPADR
jgi:hypothetical protein